MPAWEEMLKMVHSVVEGDGFAEGEEQRRGALNCRRVRQTRRSRCGAV